MNRVIVGIYDPGADRAGDGRRVLAGVIGDRDGAGVEEHGHLTIAFDGAGEGRRRPVDLPCCLVDGHVYNLAEVAGRLRAPSATPDLEGTLARGFATLGDSLLPALRGDFALVSWSEDGSGLLACDQLGGRGLVFHRHGARLVFASEIRHLLPLLATRPEPDHASVAHWLALSGPPADRTMFAGVRRIRPGHLMRFGTDSEGQRAYWRPRYRETIKLSREHAAAELRTSIQRAIERRATPQERTGVMLSGGLDSSSVAALAMRSLPADRAPHAAYSAVFPKHRSVDESRLIEGLSREIDLPSVRIAVEEGSVLAGAAEYLSTWHVPPTSPNLLFWLPLLRRAAADGVTVMLDGEGGDEMFGFSGYLIGDRLRAGRLPSAIGLARRFPSGSHNDDPRRVLARLAAYGLRRALPVPAAIRRMRAARRDPQVGAPSWFTPETARAYADTDEEWSWLEEPAPLWAAWQGHSLTWSAGPVVGYDHIRQRSKLAGLEARHPLTDVDVIELVLKLPPELAFDAALTRPLLRDAVAGTLPDELRLRTGKSYFNEFFEDTLAGSDLPLARSLLARPEAEVGRYVDMGMLGKELLTAPPPGGEARSMWAAHLWRLATAECWLRSQSDGSFLGALLGDERLRRPRYKLLEPF